MHFKKIISIFYRRQPVSSCRPALIKVDGPALREIKKISERN